MRANSYPSAFSRISFVFRNTLEWTVSSQDNRLASACMRIGVQCADSLAPDPLAGTHSVMSSEQDNSGRHRRRFSKFIHKVGFRLLESKRQASATGNSHRAIVSISYICPGDRFTVRRDKGLGK